MRLLGEVRRLAERLGLLDDAGVARRIGHLVAAFDALWALTKRNVSEAARTGVPGIGGAVFNLNGTVTVTRSTLTGNTAYQGAGIENLGAGSSLGQPVANPLQTASVTLSVTTWPSRESVGPNENE